MAVVESRFISKVKAFFKKKKTRSVGHPINRDLPIILVGTITSYCFTLVVGGGGRHERKVETSKCSTPMLLHSLPPTHTPSLSTSNCLLKGGVTQRKKKVFATGEVNTRGRFRTGCLSGLSGTLSLPLPLSLFPPLTSSKPFLQSTHIHVYLVQGHPRTANVRRSHEGERRRYPKVERARKRERGRAYEGKGEGGVNRIDQGH